MFFAPSRLNPTGKSLLRRFNRIPTLGLHVVSKQHYNRSFPSSRISSSWSPILGNRPLLIDYRPIKASEGNQHRSLGTQSSQDESSPVASGSGRSKVRSIVELMRWHKPTGTILALTPALWSVGLATLETSPIPDPRTMAIFTVGAVVARGMGCTLNDILDRKYDRLVERTKMRPIACGDISTKEALFYLAIQSTVGLYVLCLNNLSVIELGLFSGLMISTYPLFKRFTYWPQAMLALTMNWGVLMGYAAVRGAVHIEDLSILLPIYAGSIFWTLYYDTIYAHQDKTDDKFIGVKSTALKLGENSKKFLTYMSGGMAISLTMAGAMTQQQWPYYLSIAAAALLQSHQVRTVNLDNMDECWRMFDQQKYIGLMILSGVLVSVALKSQLNVRKVKANELKAS